MGKAKLLIIAGCNGSGKSSFSKAFTKNNLTPYDYDKVFKLKYDSLIPSELRDVMAHNLARKDLEEHVRASIKNKLDFCYETNFNSTPLYWPKKFKKAGYELEIVFFCLNSIDKAKERVRIRFENGGHFVPDNEVSERFKLGYHNLNKNWGYFDTVNLFETSTYNATPEHLLTIKIDNLMILNNFPNYLKSLLPDFYKHVKNN